MESIEAIVNTHITALWLLDRITCFTKSITERLQEAVKAGSASYLLKCGTAGLRVAEIVVPILICQ